MKDRLGRRIVVYGPTGVGKTTLSNRLGAALDLGVIEMDALIHRPNWELISWEEAREKLEAVLDSHPDGWVCDGNYYHVRSVTLSEADTVIWLNLPWRVIFPRLLAREIRNVRAGVLFWGTNRSSWRRSFYILLWSIRQHHAHGRAVRRDLATIPHVASIHELRSAPEVEVLLREIEDEAQSPSAPLLALE